MRLKEEIHNPVYDEILDNYDLFDRLQQFFMVGK